MNCRILIGAELFGHLPVFCFDYPDCYRRGDEVVDVANFRDRGDRMRDGAVSGGDRVFDNLSHAILRILTFPQVLKVPPGGGPLNNANGDIDRCQCSHVTGKAPAPADPSREHGVEQQSSRKARANPCPAGPQQGGFDQLFSNKRASVSPHPIAPEFRRMWMVSTMPGKPTVGDHRAIRSIRSTATRSAASLNAALSRWT